MYHNVYSSLQEIQMEQNDTRIDIKSDHHKNSQPMLLKSTRKFIMYLVIPITIVLFSLLAYYLNNNILTNLMIVVSAISSIFVAVLTYHDKISKTKKSVHTMGFEKQIDEYKERQGCNWMFWLMGDDNDYEDGHCREHGCNCEMNRK